MADLIVSVDDAAELLGLSTRRIEQLSGTSKARAGRGRVDLALLIPAVVADLKHRAETATARRQLLEAQTAAKRQDAEIRRHEYVRVSDVRQLVTLVADLLHAWRQQATSALYYGSPSIPEDARRQAAHEADVRLRDEVRRMLERITKELDDFIAHRKRRVDLADPELH